MNGERLMDTLSAFAGCNDTPGQGVTRFSWSPADRQARELLTTLCTGIGLQVRVDGMGNVRARMRGQTQGPAVLVGSHLDSVRHGGTLDGIYGVTAALEALRSLAETGFEPACDIELIAFAEEEGSNFGCTCLGSKAVTGQMDEAGLKALHDGASSCLDRLVSFGLHPENLPGEQIDAGYARAWLEVHIEQNARLEQTGSDLGLVSAICGMRLHRLRFTGCSDHAASSMGGRRDPMAGFAEFAFAMEQLWRCGTLARDYACTIGSLHCEPDVPIAIPGSVTFTVDVRHVDVPVLEGGWRRIEDLARRTAEARGLEMRVERLSASGGAAMDKDLTGLMREEALAEGAVCLDMVSGPAHDAACLAARVPSALLFVPSIGGLSHCAREATDPRHLKLGATVLERTLRRLAGRA